KAATVTSTLQALDGAALAHLACHGHFRSDSPLFSSLELADGPLNVYDLQNLRRPPGIVVLSACDLALSRLHPGDELLGVAARPAGPGPARVAPGVGAGPRPAGAEAEGGVPPWPHGGLPARRCACKGSNCGFDVGLRLPRARIGAAEPAAYESGL